MFISTRIIVVVVVFVVGGGGGGGGGGGQHHIIVLLMGTQFDHLVRYIVARPASATIPVAPPGNSVTVATHMSPPSVFRWQAVLDGSK